MPNPSCAPPTTVNVCDCELPTTLYMTLDMDACAALDGTVIPLSYIGVVGAEHVWRGTFDAGGCGTLTAEARLNGFIGCQWTASVYNGSGDTCLSLPAYPTSGDVCLSPVSQSVSAFWNGANCPCCSSAGMFITVSL